MSLATHWMSYVVQLSNIPEPKANQAIRENSGGQIRGIQFAVVLWVPTAFVYSIRFQEPNMTSSNTRHWGK